MKQGKSDVASPAVSLFVLDVVAYVLPYKLICHILQVKAKCLCGPSIGRKKMDG